MPSIWSEAEGQLQSRKILKHEAKWKVHSKLILSCLPANTHLYLMVLVKAMLLIIINLCTFDLYFSGLPLQDSMLLPCPGLWQGPS